MEHTYLFFRRLGLRALQAWAATVIVSRYPCLYSREVLLWVGDGMKSWTDHQCRESLNRPASSSRP